MLVFIIRTDENDVSYIYFVAKGIMVTNAASQINGYSCVSLSINLKDLNSTSSEFPGKTQGSPRFASQGTKWDSHYPY